MGLELFLLISLGLLALGICWFWVADADIRLCLCEKYGRKPDHLRGKVAWITGASSGIGEALAYELARAGCRLVISARRLNELQRVKKQCQEFRPDVEVLVLPLDMLDSAKIEEAVKEVIQHFGKVDILVNNAGRTQHALAIETSSEVEHQIMELNFHSTVRLTLAVLPHMINNKSGHIMVTSSLGGKIGVPGSSMYSAAKFAVQGYYDALRVEHATDNIKVTLACPGPVFSNIREVAFTGKPGEEYGAKIQTEERRLTSERCARLMAVALANDLYEAWISCYPPLLFAYMFQYMPSLTRWIACLIGVEAVTRARH